MIVIFYYIEVRFSAQIRSPITVGVSLLFNLGIRLTKLVLLGSDFVG